MSLPMPYNPTTTLDALKRRWEYEFHQRAVKIVGQAITAMTAGSGWEHTRPTHGAVTLPRENLSILIRIEPTIYPDSPHAPHWVRISTKEGETETQVFDSQALVLVPGEWTSLLSVYGITPPVETASDEEREITRYANLLKSIGAQPHRSYIPGDIVKHNGTCFAVRFCHEYEVRLIDLRTGRDAGKAPVWELVKVENLPVGYALTRLGYTLRLVKELHTELNVDHLRFVVAHAPLWLAGHLVGLLVCLLNELPEVSTSHDEALPHHIHALTKALADLARAVEGKDEEQTVWQAIVTILQGRFAPQMRTALYAEPFKTRA